MLYGPNWALVGGAGGLSLVGFIDWGTLLGPMLPFLLSRHDSDPVSQSAPFVVTMADVTGLVIYSPDASLVLRGTLH